MDHDRLGRILTSAAPGCLFALLIATSCSNRKPVPEPTAMTATAQTTSTDAAEGDIQAWIDSRFYADSDIVSSFHSSFGETIDCIGFYAQRSVKGLQATGTAVVDVAHPPPLPPLPAGVPPVNAAPQDAFVGQLDDEGRPRSCPAGTVMSKRPTVARIVAAGGLDAWRAARTQERPCGSTCTNVQSCYENDCFLGQGTPTQGAYDHSVGIQKSFAYGIFGSLIFASVDIPTLVGPSLEHSISQFWLQTGSCENWRPFSGDLAAPSVGPNECTLGIGTNVAVQSLEGGWWVDSVQQYPGRPELFFFITPDGYQTGCLAKGAESFGDCCGSTIFDGGTGSPSNCYVQVQNASYVPGQVLTANGGSGNGRTQSEISIQVWNGSQFNPPGKYEGWFIYVNGSWVGWYPPQAFLQPANTASGTYGQMAYGPASYFQTGGEIYDSLPNGQHTYASMGTGYAPPASTYPYVSYDRNVYYMDSQAGYHATNLSFNAGPSCLGDYGTPGTCGYNAGYWTNSTAPGFGAYSLSTTGSPPGYNWGNYFFFGGGQGECVGGGEHNDVGVCYYTP